MRALVLVIGLVSVALAFPGGEKTPQQEEKSFLDEGLDVAYRFIKDCGDKDVSLCLKMRALTFVDRALRKNEISITDGVRLVRSEQAQESMRYERVEPFETTKTWHLTRTVQNLKNFLQDRVM